MDSISSIIKNKFDTKYQLLEKQIKNIKTLFNHTLSTYSYQQFLNIYHLIIKAKNKHNLIRNIHAVTKKIIHSTQWILELKNQLTIYNFIILIGQQILPFAIQYLSTISIIQIKRQKGQIQSINSQVNSNIVLNFKTYLQKICQNYELYTEIRKGKQNWQPIPAPHILFKIINIVNYLLAAKSTLHKLFKNYDMVQVFCILAKSIIQDLNLWYIYYNHKLIELVQNSEQIERTELKSIEQLIYQSDRIYSKITEFNAIVLIYNIEINTQKIEPIILPPHFKAKFQLANISQNPKESAKNNFFIEKVIKIDSRSRNFVQDVGNEIRKKNRSNSKHIKLNKTYHVTKQFIEQI